MKSQHDFEASLAVISSNMKAYCDGNQHAYRPVAVELRKLLCDTQARTDISLVKRLFPNLRLRPLSGNQDRIDEHTSLYIPGRMRFCGQGGNSMSELFNESAPSMALDEWLNQKMFDVSTTVRSFIRSVADKEGAHSDKLYNKTLGKVKSVVLYDDTLAAKAVLSIGRYVVKALALQFVNDNISEIAPFITAKYNEMGRGAALLSLSDFADQVSSGISLKYESTAVVEGYFKRDSKNAELIRQALESYDSSISFLILITDLNGEIWVYQQALKKDKK